MPLVIDNDDFKKNAWAELTTVGAILKTLKTNPDHHIMCHDREDLGDTVVALSESDNSKEVGDFLDRIVPDETKPYKIAGVFLAGERNGNHYIGAVFEKEPGKLGKLSLIDTLASKGKSSYQNHLDDIAKEFKGRFGPKIQVELNPEGKVLYQQESNSCAFTCKYTIEHLLQNKELKANKSLGITKEKDGIFKCEIGAEKLREREKRIIQFYEKSEKIADKVLKKGIWATVGEIMKIKDKELKNHLSLEVQKINRNPTKKELVSFMTKFFVDRDDEPDSEPRVNHVMKLMKGESEEVNSFAEKILNSNFTEKKKDFLINAIADTASARKDKGYISRAELKNILDKAKEGRAIAKGMKKSLSTNQNDAPWPPKKPRSSSRESSL